MIVQAILSHDLLDRHDLALERTAIDVVDARRRRLVRHGAAGITAIGEMIEPAMLLGPGRRGLDTKQRGGWHMIPAAGRG